MYGMKIEAIIDRKVRDSRPRDATCLRSRSDRNVFSRPPGRPQRPNERQAFWL